MSRSALIFVRIASFCVAAVLSGLYVKYVLPIDRNALDLKLCVLEFLGAYLAMTFTLIIFTRIRKFDLGLICWAVLSMSLIGQMIMSMINQAPLPHLSQGLSGIMGILAALLPTFIVAFRGEARSSRRTAKFVDSRKMISPTSSTHLIHN